MGSVYGSSVFARPPSIPVPQYQYHSPDGTSKWKGPRRVCIFCTMAIVLPSLLISIPLLMRFVIYGSSNYIVHPSDMIILDKRISTTWCQAEIVKLNFSFTAYVTDGEPKTFEQPATLKIEQNMEIPDDHKKYWGLYLLPGSSFKIRVCARHKGGTLLIVRGNQHMQYCAYVGEADSTGNSDEVSGSTSVELNRKFKNAQVRQPGTISTEVGKDEITIISKLKDFLDSNPQNRDKLQKSLENWMLLNSTKPAPASILKHDSASVETTVTTDSPTVAPPNLESIEHGRIHRRRREVEVRRDTESGENGAFEDDSFTPDLNDFSKNSTNNVSSDTPDTIWKQEHNKHSGDFNFTLNHDQSGSESESSWSSSEEALLKCQGIVKSIIIPQEDSCVAEGSFDSLSLTTSIKGQSSNVYAFNVTEPDYYYFIFGSENEKETNLIRTLFELQKVEWKLPQPITNCTDVHECQISFRFASSQKVVIRLPQPDPNESAETMTFVAETECQPRAHLYLIFVVLVPLVILLFAFQ